MRPIYWQLAAVVAFVAIMTIIYLNNKVDTLEAQIKKAETPQPRPLTNPTAANGAFKPANPAA